MAFVVWGAGLLAALAAIVIYIAVQNYDPTVSCDELLAKTVEGELGQAPAKVDAWDDWELLCGYYDH